jgi:glucose-1-phosphate thymidylyltransferase
MTGITGVILAGGWGTRLHPHTRVQNKHLLPVYDKPMIAYPLQYLLNAGITNYFIVTGGEHFAAIAQLLGKGKDLKETLGLEGRIDSLVYGVQNLPGEKPKGIAEALGLARKYVGNDHVAVVLGDNIYEDEQFLRGAVQHFTGGGHIFLHQVPDDALYETATGPDGATTRRAKYGMAELGPDGTAVLGIEEKPVTPKSNYAVTGAYLYDNRVFDVIPTLKPSRRGELEITDVNNYFISQGQMRSTVFKGWWTDAGSIPTLNLAGNLIRQKREGPDKGIQRCV